MKRLKWQELFSEDRERPRSAKADEGKMVVRNAFEADYDRIVGSSSVRRLQDKAQVFPLQKDDVVRTRLTHSLEVSALAKSLGKAVGVQLKGKDGFKAGDEEKLAALLQTAGLIHDLGNPPFGHYGETVIQEWTKKKKNLKKEMAEQELQDFLCFDGNVQNLRIVTKLQTMNDAHGANFTYATLATLMKYPCSSINRPNKKKKKFGYFKSEEDIIMRIRKKTGLEEHVRHPATLLLEAADDIIYRCDDIEDGVKKGYIHWETEFESLCEQYKGSEKYGDLLQRIKESKAHPDMAKSEAILASARVFRNMVQSFLFEKTIEAFLDNYNDIMCGQYEGDLLKEEDEFIKSLKEITSRNCFACNEVLSLEIAGHKVLEELLNIFYKVLFRAKEKDLEDIAKYSGKVYRKISENYKFIALYDYDTNKKKSFDELTSYDKLHLIVDFISGMTDSYAVSLYKELTGISLPE